MTAPQLSLIVGPAIALLVCAAIRIGEWLADRR